MKDEKILEWILSYFIKQYQNGVPRGQTHSWLTSWKYAFLQVIEWVEGKK